MLPEYNPSDEKTLSFKVFHELMARKVSEILLVSSPYDAFIMEEDGQLATRIIHEYRGLNLSRPPRLTWVSTAAEALEALSGSRFDLVLTMPRLGDMNAYRLGREIKKKFPDLPVFLLAHTTRDYLEDPKYNDRSAIDKIFVWRGNTDLLLALIKSVEDRMNVEHDTARADVRVIIMVEDSPYYCSSILPLLYKEIVIQTQAVMEESLNEAHRILRMRARPKILVAETYEEAENLYRKFHANLLCVLSDVRFPKDGVNNERAGFKLLSMIKREAPDVPLLVCSSEETNREPAADIPAVFLNKRSTSLHEEIRAFFIQHLGFGDFVFRFPDGAEIARAGNLRALERILPSIPDESVFHHAMQNGFSLWLMARSEIQLASKLRPIKATDFTNTAQLKEFLIFCIREQRKRRQKGIVAEFLHDDFDPVTDFLKMGKGSLGGKARGLAFISTLMREYPEFQDAFPDINIGIPKTLVVTTEAFDAFVNQNNLKEFAAEAFSDRQITELFLKAKFPEWLRQNLELFLAYANYPLAVRSSSLLEDSQHQSFAGIYKTYMVPNNYPGITVRLEQLIKAIKLVYASVYMAASRAFASSTLQRIEEEKMAIILQQLTGTEYDHIFYPAISGVAQSYNFYPISHLKPEEGIAHLALGLGKTVVEGETNLRFSPKHPEFLPQFSTVDTVLKNSQRFFYALKTDGFPENFGMTDGKSEGSTLVRLEIDDVVDQAPVKFLSSTFNPEDQKIRDTAQGPGYRVLTFANILKYKAFQLSEIISGILKMGQEGMGCPVEIEFAFDLAHDDRQKPEFSLLQMRPMGVKQQHTDVDIGEDEIRRAFCYSTQALGNGDFEDLRDIIFVKHDVFDPAKTIQIAAEIGKMNGLLEKEKRKYLLLGPGRWGSADRWLGIPVKWNDISCVGAIVETTVENLKADPSQGTHFFHNITSMGISYITISQDGKNFIDWSYLNSLPRQSESIYLGHIRLERPIRLKVDGKTSRAVIIGHHHRS